MHSWHFTKHLASPYTFFHPFNTLRCCSAICPANSGKRAANPTILLLSLYPSASAKGRVAYAVPSTSRDVDMQETSLQRCHAYLSLYPRAPESCAHECKVRNGWEINGAAGQTHGGQLQKSRILKRIKKKKICTTFLIPFPTLCGWNTSIVLC